MKSQAGKDYILSTATLDDGSEATGVGTFEVGEEVRSWFDDKYNRIKIAKLKEVGNVAVGLLCLIGLMVMIGGAWLLIQVVRETYADSAPTTFKQQILPRDYTLTGSPDKNIQPATNKVQLTGRP